MAESSFSGSQESLPLSQETFSALINQLPLFSNLLPFENTQFFPDEVLGDIAFQDDFQEPPCYMDSITAPVTEGVHASMPASSNWPGAFSFQISFPSQENSKGDIWTYSGLTNKLFVKRDAPCPIIFSSDLIGCKDIFIRATALFTSSPDVVQRCVLHSYSECDSGIKEAYHLIRCESVKARYMCDPHSGRHSVVVPYEIPFAGQKFTSFVYKFKCLSSCSGGPNRKPTMLVFTLEKGNEILGRQKLDFKVCTNPSRDRKSEEKKLSTAPREEMQKKVSKKSNLVDYDVDTCDSLYYGEEKGSYTIKVHNVMLFRLLRHIRNNFDRYETGRTNFLDYLQRYLMHIMSSSEDEGNDESNNRSAPVVNCDTSQNQNEEIETFPLQSQVSIPNSYLNEQNTEQVSSSFSLCESWSGPFAFTVSFPYQDGVKKNTWTYSHTMKKLYVGKDVLCPITFSSTLKDYAGVCIRAVVHFKSSPDVVHRCVTHSYPELKLEIFEAEHFIRCNSEMATYWCDPHTKRHSVLVPFEAPAAGQKSTTYLYRCTCLGSCPGGPNRRALMLVFMLEKGDQVLGRQVVDLKVCSCPARDRNKDEKQVSSNDQEESVKRKSSHIAIDELTGLQKDTCDNLSYTLKVKTEKCYNLLTKMKTYYEVYQNRKSYSVDGISLRQYFQYIITSSSDELEEVNSSYSGDI